MQKAFAIIAFFIFSFNLNCKKAPTENDDSMTDVESGRRDYVWTVDTIKASFLTLYSIWGNSSNNVWVVGTGSASDNVWRYNGQKWENKAEGSNWSPKCAFGFGNDIWFANYNQTGFIVHYNGQSFIREYELKYEGYETGIIDIYGLNKYDIYAVGTKMINNYKEHNGVIYHYDGNNWSVKTIIEDGGNLTRIRYSPFNNKYYILSISFPDSLKIGQKIYEYDGNNIKVIYDELISEETLCVFNNIQEGMYITIGKKVYRYKNDHYELMFEVNVPNFGGQLWGRSSKDIIIRMQDGFAHYNGENIRYILKLPNNLSSGHCIVFDNELFCIAHNNVGYELIYHGKLKQEP